MKSISLFILFLFSSILSHSQELPKTVRLNTLNNTLLNECLYQTFLDGKVIYKDGSYGKAKLNFDPISQEMLFIDPKHDTLKLGHPEKTAMVTIASDTFCFFKNTFLEKTTHYGDSINLFQKLDLKHIDTENKQPYGGYTSVSDNSSTTQANLSPGIGIDRNLIYRRSNEIYISIGHDDYSRLKIATITKIFPQYKNEIIAFSKKNKTDCDKLPDALKLMEYILTLSPAVQTPH